VPKYRASRIAVSTLMARFALTTALIRFIGTGGARQFVEADPNLMEFVPEQGARMNGR
jgi:hypothetical protein